MEQLWRHIIRIHQDIYFYRGSDRYDMLMSLASFDFTVGGAALGGLYQLFKAKKPQDLLSIIPGSIVGAVLGFMWVVTIPTGIFYVLYNFCT
jgi:hypothetical protein